MIIVMGEVTVSPADASRFRREIEAIDPTRRAESGCHFYAVAEIAGGRLLVAERWRDEAALAAHLAHPQTVALVARWAGRLRASVQKYAAGAGQALDA